MLSKKLKIISAFALVLLLCGCNAKIKMQPSQSSEQEPQPQYMRPEPIWFHTLQNGELQMGIGENASAGVYERVVKMPVIRETSYMIASYVLNPGGDFPQSYSGFACENKLAFLNNKGGEEFEIKISDDGGESWFNGEIQKDKAFVNSTLGKESYIGFTTAQDGWLALNSDTESLAAAFDCITRLYFTQDGGKTWYLGNAPEGLEGMKIAGAFFETPLKGTIFYHDSADYRSRAEVRTTEDGGASWKRQALRIVPDMEGCAYQAFRLCPPQYVKSSLLENGEEWVLPVKLTYSSLYQDEEAAKTPAMLNLEQSGKLEIMNESLTRSGYIVKYPFFCRKGIWARSYNAFISPDYEPVIGINAIYEAISELDKTLASYKNGSVKISGEELCSYAPFSKPGAEVSGIYGISRSLEYIFTEDDMLYLFKDDTTYTSGEVMLVLKQNEGAFKAEGLHILSEGFYVD